MKKLLIVFMLLISVVSYAHADTQGATSDANRHVYYMAPFKILTIAADTAFDTTSYLGFAPAVDVEFYFGTDTETTFTAPALIPVGLKPGIVLKLKVETKCLMF